MDQRRALHALLPVLAIGLLLPGSAAAAVDPEPDDPPQLVDLGTIGGQYARAEAVNDAGLIAGWGTPADSGTTRAFTGDVITGKLQELHNPGFFALLARDVAEDGTIVGLEGSDVLCGFAPCPDMAFTYRPDPPTFGTVPSFSPDRGNDAYGVNSAGVVVGWMDTSTIPVVQIPHAFRYDMSADELTDLGTFADGAASAASAVSETGVIVGASGINTSGECYPQVCGDMHAFRWTEEGGELVDLGTLGGTNSVAYAVNASGWVAGESQVAGDSTTHAFLYDPEADDMIDLGTLGGASSTAYGINDAGWVVGASKVEGNAETHAFAYDPVNEELVDLGSLGGPQTIAFDINNCGVIVGGGMIPSGETHAFRAAYELYTDVALPHPFFADICWLGRSGATDGFPDGTFRPVAPVSRQVLVAWLYRLAGSPPGPFPDPMFDDVAPSDPFITEISWAASEGVATGYVDGTFRPTAGLTRQTLVACLYRLAGSPSGPFPAPGFTDVGPSSPFFTEISWAADAGYVEGFADGTFRPTAVASRQVGAAVLAQSIPGLLDI